MLARARPQRLVVRPEVIAQRAAATRFRGADERDLHPVERARERGVDAGRERALHAAGERQHAPRMARRRPALGRPRRGNPGGKRARQQRAREPAGRQRDGEPGPARQALAQQPAAGALERRTFDRALGDAMSDVEQPPEADPRRTGGLATAAAKAAIEMQPGRRSHRFAFEHLLDQVDASARPVELVAEELIRRAGRRAEAAMHAGAQYRFGVAPIRGVANEVGQMRFQAQSSAYIRPGLKMPAGSSAAFSR